MQISPKKKDRCQISDMRTGRWLLCWSLAACVCVCECVYERNARGQQQNLAMVHALQRTRMGV